MLSWQVFKQLATTKVFFPYCSLSCIMLMLQKGVQKGNSVTVFSFKYKSSPTIHLLESFCFSCPLRNAVNISYDF